MDKPEFFVEGDFGKERRVREVGETAVAPIVPIMSGVCAPLLGAKFGVDIPVAEGWRLAPSAGVALNFDTGGNSSVFATLEINRWFDEKGFFGTGIGVWDFTHSDTVSPTWLLHGGRQIWQATGPKRTAAYWVMSGRLFLDAMDDISNNYQFWTGVRFVFK